MTNREKTTSRQHNSFRKIEILFLALVLIIITCSSCQAVFLLSVLTNDMIITERQKDVSPDGNYAVVYKNVGDALIFGPQKVRVQFLHQGKVISSFDDEIADDGGSGQVETVWYPHGADAILMGCEQRPSHHGFSFDPETDVGMNTQEEAVSVLKERYGDEVLFLHEDGEYFLFQLGEISFRVKNDVTLTDNYEETKKLMEESSQ